METYGNCIELLLIILTLYNKSNTNVVDVLHKYECTCMNCYIFQNYLYKYKYITYNLVALPNLGTVFYVFLAWTPSLTLHHYHLSRDMIKPTKWLCAQRRLRSAWSSSKSDQSSMSAWRTLGFLATHWAHMKDWSDWADALAGLSLRWAHFVGFVVSWLSCYHTSDVHHQTCLNDQTYLICWRPELVSEVHTDVSHLFL